MKKTALLILAILLIAQTTVGSAPAKPKGDESAQVGKGGTLTFKLKDADIKSVLTVFAKQLGVNIVAGDDVTGKVSFSFTNVRPREGLEAVLRAKGYDWFQEGDTWVVTSKSTVRTYLLEYASAAEVKTALDVIAETGDSISVNDSYNALIVKTSTKNIARIEKAIKDMDVPPQQVMVEARILEIRHEDGGDAGVDIKYTNPRDTNDKVETNNFANEIDPLNPTQDKNGNALIGFYAQVFSGNVQAYVSALLASTNYNLVAAPRIATLNHKEASILIGNKIGYRSATITDTGTVYAVNFLTTGTNLTITPHIGEGGYIRMKIYPKISEGEVTNDQPREKTTETKSEVLVKDGQTIVIGGLTKTSESEIDLGVPILMDIPLLGSLFRRTTILTEKRELLVFVTPHILTPEYLTKMDKEYGKIKEQEKNEGAGFIH